MMALPALQPNPDRALTYNERMRLHTAILEAELEIDRLPGWIPDDWIRLLHAPVTSSRALSGCYRVELIAYANVRLRMHQAGLLDEPRSRWWHRFTDWWLKW